MQNRVSAITRKIEQLPPDLQHEVEDFVEFLQEKRPREAAKKQQPKFDWEGALGDLKDEYTSVELQHKILDMRGR